MADWNAIKIEYITTNTSYRRLAEKYGVSATQIYNIGGKEGWVDQRKQYLSKVEAKILNAASSAQAAKIASLQTVSDKLLIKIEALVDKEMLTAQNVRNITGALRDLKEIQMIKSDADVREQEARIKKLQKEAEKEAESSAIPTLVVEGLPEEFRV